MGVAPTFFVLKLSYLIENIMDTSEIEKRLKALIEPVIKEKEIELVELSLKRGAEGLNLRVLVDRPSGITVAECAKLNGELGAVLDNGLLIQERYILEVSSPGLDRPIVSDNDFRRALNKLVKIVTSQNVSGLNVIIGTLKEFNSDEVRVSLEGRGEFVIPRNFISKAKLEIKF